MRRTTPRQSVAAISALATVAVVLSGTGAPLRAPLVFWFLLVCPGMVVMEAIGVEDRLLAATATVAISIALGVVVAETLLFLGAWSPTLGLVVLAALTLVGAALPPGTAPVPRWRSTEER